MRQICAPIISVLMLLTLGACTQGYEGEGDAVPPVNPEETADEAVAEQVSILRPDVEAETVKPEVVSSESYTATIGFPDGGSELDAKALEVLEEVKASEQFAANGAIILGGHSDSAGTDAANERAAEARGLAVAEWLIAAGAEPRRIDVIVFGEQNPTEPNALADGSPNEEGRALNRRVEIEILASTPEAADAADSEAGEEP